jgi:Flp pilus assembly pilin Flp
VSVLARFLREDDAVVTVEWSVIAGFAAVGFALKSESLTLFANRALDQIRDALRTLVE